MLIGIYKLFMPEPPVDIWYMLIWNTVVYLGWTIMILPYAAMGRGTQRQLHGSCEDHCRAVRCGPSRV